MTLRKPQKNILDSYQERYQKHQARKKAQLTTPITRKKIKYTNKEKKGFFNILNNRKSQRVFNGEPISTDVTLKLHQALGTCPSSCDRKAINLKWITERQDKEILSGLLVGGVGWINRADKILLLFADPVAYKAPGEIDFMPYLDAGVVIQTAYLATEALGIGCCFVNPNIRNDNKEFFKARFGDKIFCGALILGNY